jgi:hypothetical protein
VELAFLKDVGLTWETRAPLLLRPNDRPELGPQRLAHLIAADYVRCGYIPQELFDAYFRFAIVRNPWSRAVSLYKHLDHNMPFRGFVSDWLPEQFARPDWNGDFWFLRPQTDFVMKDGRMVVQEVLRLEKLVDEFGRVATASKLSTPLPHVNRSSERAPRQPRSLFKRLRLKLKADRRDRHDLWTDYYDAETTQGIAQLYAADIEAFDYRSPVTRRKSP